MYIQYMHIHSYNTCRFTCRPTGTCMQAFMHKDILHHTPIFIMYEHVQCIYIYALTNTHPLSLKGLQEYLFLQVSKLIYSIINGCSEFLTGTYADYSKIYFQYKTLLK